MAGQCHGPRVGDDLALMFQPVEDARHQGVVRQVGERCREVGARDRRLSRMGRMQPGQARRTRSSRSAAKSRSTRDASGAVQGELDQAPDSASAARPASTSVDGQPRECGQAALGPGREAQECQGRTQAIERVARSNRPRRSIAVRSRRR